MAIPELLAAQRLCYCRPRVLNRCTAKEDRNGNYNYYYYYYYSPHENQNAPKESLSFLDWDKLVEEHRGSDSDVACKDILQSFEPESVGLEGQRVKSVRSEEAAELARKNRIVSRSYMERDGYTDTLPEVLAMEAEAEAESVPQSIDDVSGLS